MINPSTLHGFSAFLSLIIPVLYVNKSADGKSTLFWLLLGAAFAGCASWTGILFVQAGALSLSIAMWLSISVTLGCFIAVCIFSQNAWRLSLLLLPYCALMALIAFLWQTFPAHHEHVQAWEEGFDIWTLIHIGFSILTYSFATLAAIAGLSGFIVEQSLKNKQPTSFSRKLPSVFDNEVLLFRLLLSAALILMAGIFSGMVISYQEHGSILQLDHKTILTLASFGLICALLWSNHRYGTRGKSATRLVLMAYLTLSLGFLGVKFVTDVLMA